MEESWLMKSQKEMMLAPQPILYQSFLLAKAGLSEWGLPNPGERKDDERDCKKEAQVVTEITQACKKGGRQCKEPLTRQLDM